jgi:hypothetical protein
MYKVKDYNNPSKKMFDDTGLDITYYIKKSRDSLFDLQSPRKHVFLSSAELALRALRDHVAYTFYVEWLFEKKASSLGF